MSNNDIGINSNQDDEIVVDLKEIGFHLRRHWLFIAFVTIMCTAVMAVYSFCLVTPMYQAKATIYTQSSGSTTTSEILQSLQIGEQIAPDYEVFFKSIPVVEQVIESLGLETTVDELNETVEITNPSDTHMIVVTVTNADAQLAADIANAYVEYGVEVVREVDIKEPYVVEQARAKYKIVSPNYTQNLLIGFFVGLIASCSIIILQVIFNDKLKGTDSIERTLGLPVISTIYEDNTFHVGDKGKSKKHRKKARKQANLAKGEY